MARINNVQDLYRSFISDDVPNAKQCAALIAKAVYKGTDCGACVTFDREGAHCGSIVEGSQAEVTRPVLVWGFDHKDFWDLLDSIEKEACELWHEANDDNGMEEED